MKAINNFFFPFVCCLNFLFHFRQISMSLEHQYFFSDVSNLSSRWCNKSFIHFFGVFSFFLLLNFTVYFIILPSSLLQRKLKTRVGGQVVVVPSIKQPCWRGRITTGWKVDILLWVFFFPLRCRKTTKMKWLKNEIINGKADVENPKRLSAFHNYAVLGVGTLPRVVWFFAWILFFLVRERWKRCPLNLRLDVSVFLLVYLGAVTKKGNCYDPNIGDLRGSRTFKKLNLLAIFFDKWKIQNAVDRNCENWILEKIC